MEDLAKTCERAARAGGKVLIELRDRFTVREKGPSDLVTEADLTAQSTIFEMINQEYPNHVLLGEEEIPDLSESAPASEYRWLVDPLDGTTNYVHGLDQYCTSVAVEKGGELLAGCVFDPTRNECFSGWLNGGAFLNGQPLTASRVARLNDALVAASFSAKVAFGSPEIQRFINVLYVAQAIRRLGSAALNLCYVAAGRLDGYWATSVKAWDVAAGVLLVREAGGQISDVNGGAFDLNRPRLAVSATEPLQTELISCLNQDRSDS